MEGVDAEWEEPISPELVLVSPGLRELALARSDAWKSAAPRPAPPFARTTRSPSRTTSFLLRASLATAAVGVVLWEILLVVAVGGAALAVLALLLTLVAG
jgi:hypothetical protein